MRGYGNQGRRKAALAMRALAAIVVFIAPLTGTGCRRSRDAAEGMKIETRIAPQPVRVGAATVTVSGIADGLGEPLAGVHVQIEGDMNHPGMPPVFADAPQVAPGVYQAKIDFNMPGDWVVLVHIRLADGRRIEQQLDVRGVEGR